MAHRILAVGGMAAEARIARTAGWDAVVTGGRQELLRQRLAAIGERPRAVVSFGLAGGLDPALPPGTIVVGEAVVAPDGRRWPCDAAALAAIRARLRPLQPAVGLVAGVDAPLLSVANKAALRMAWSTAAVDMESHLAAAHAAAAGIPFAIVRAVCDPAGRALPALTAAALTADGTTDIAALLRGLAREPAALPALLRLAGDARRAFAALRRVALLLGPSLGLDLG